MVEQFVYTEKVTGSSPVSPTKLNFMQEIKCIINGKVQMIMFRDFIKKKAQTLGIVGTVENLGDGTVEVIAQGKKEKLEKLIGYLHKGPFLARVIRVDTKWREPKESFTGFTIVYS